MKKYISEFINFLWPFYESYTANKEIDKDIQRQENDNTIQEFQDDFDKTEIVKDYDATIYRKDKLEDKAKTNIFGITIAISLITGAHTFLNNIYTMYSSRIIGIISFILFLLIILYLLVSGISVVKVLCDLNRIEVPQKNKCVKKPDEYFIDCIKCTNINNQINLMRNNIICSSFKGIRNALIGLFVLLVIITFPIAYTQSGTDKTNVASDYVFSFDDNTISYVSDKDNLQLIENIISNRINKSTSNAKVNSFVDQSHNLYIKFIKNDDVIIVKLIEPIEP